MTDNQRQERVMKNTMKWLGLIALVAVIAMTAVGCDLFGNKGDGGGDSGGNNGSIRVYAPKATAITQTQLKNSSGKIVKVDSSRISANSSRLYGSLPVGTYEVQATISGLHQKRSASVRVNSTTDVRY
jgi:hypothetical protein